LLDLCKTGALAATLGIRKVAWISVAPLVRRFSSGRQGFAVQPGTFGDVPRFVAVNHLPLPPSWNWYRAPALKKSQGPIGTSAFTVAVVPSTSDVPPRMGPILG